MLKYIWVKELSDSRVKKGRGKVKTNLLFVLIAVLLLAGCATTGRQTPNEQVQQLQMQIANLNEELQRKNEEINYLEEQLGEKQMQGDSSLDESKRKSSGQKAVKTTPKNIQLALSSAGFYSGPIDGKIGKKTKKAIKEFQRANGLKVDGVVGGKTWAELRSYLE